MQGIYKIENINNGKVYIGRSKDIEKRWQEHIKMLQKGKHHSIKLQQAYNHLKNKEDLQFSVVEEVNDDSLLAEREQYWTDYYDAYHSGYSCTLIVDNPKYVRKNLIKEEKKKQLAEDYETFAFYYNRYRDKIKMTWSFNDRMQSKYYKHHVVSQVNDVLMSCERYLDYDGASVKIRPYSGGYNHLYITLYDGENILIDGPWNEIKNDELFSGIKFMTDE